MGRKARNIATCRDCRCDPATVFLWPTGIPMAATDGGFCVRCHERRVREVDDNAADVRRLYRRRGGVIV